MAHVGSGNGFEYRITDEKTLMDIGFASDWDYIDLTKKFMEDFLEVYFNGLEGVYKVGTAASELLENAVRYSGGSDVRATIVNDDATGHVILTVCNRSDRTNASRLLAMVDEMNSSDSLEYYLKRMRESVSDKDSSPGLGLARLYHETNAIISAFYEEADRMVRVKAIICIV